MNIYKWTIPKWIQSERLNQMICPDIVWDIEVSSWTIDKINIWQVEDLSNNLSLSSIQSHFWHIWDTKEISHELSFGLHSTMGF